MIEDDTRRASGDRLALYAFVGLMVGLLIVMGHNVRSANLRASGVARELAVSDGLVGQLTREHDLMANERHRLMDQIELLAAGPRERIIVQPCVEHPTPVFPRDSQFSGVAK